MASLTGFDQVVVERAAAQCAGLFGESMGFRTFVEGKDVHVKGPEEKMVLPGCNASESEVKEEGSSSHDSGSEEEEAMLGGVHVDGFLQPIEAKKSWKYKNRKKGKIVGK